MAKGSMRFDVNGHPIFSTGTVGSGLAEKTENGYGMSMTTVAEIESAIEHLPIDQVREVAAWLEEYQATIKTSAEVFAMLDSEEGEGDQWHDPK